MPAYLVVLKDLDDEIDSTVCQNDEELVTLLKNLDKDEYEIVDINTIKKFSHQYKDFCSKNPQLETGDNS